MMEKRIAQRYMRKVAGGNLQWGIDQLEGVLNLLKEVSDVWDLKPQNDLALTEKNKVVKDVVDSIRKTLSRDLTNYVHALKREKEKRQLTAAEPKPEYITPREKTLINRILRLEGLDGNGRFKKPQHGVSKAMQVLHDFKYVRGGKTYYLDIVGLIDSLKFSRALESQEHNNHWSELLMAVEPETDVSIHIKNAMLSISFHRFRPSEDKYEVLIYVA